MVYARLGGTFVGDKTAGQTWIQSIAFSETIAIGDLLVVCFARDDLAADSAAPTDTLVDNKGNTYSQAAAISGQSAAGSAVAIIFYAVAAQAVTGGTNIQFTFDFQGTTNVTAKGAVWDHFSGNATSNVLDQHTTAAGTGTSALSVGPITPSGTDYLVVAMAGWEANDSLASWGLGDTDTTAGSWSALVTGGSFSGGSAANIQAVQQYKITTGNNAQTWNMTGPSAADWRAAIASFKTPDITARPTPVIMRQAVKRASLR